MEAGDVIPEYRTCVDRPGFVITCADSRAEALAAAEEAERIIRVETVPAPTA